MHFPVLLAVEVAVEENHHILQMTNYRTVIVRPEGRSTRAETRGSLSLDSEGGRKPKRVTTYKIQGGKSERISTVSGNNTAHGSHNAQQHHRGDPFNQRQNRSHQVRRDDQSEWRGESSGSNRPLRRSPSRKSWYDQMPEISLGRGTCASVQATVQGGSGYRRMKVSRGPNGQRIEFVAKGPMSDSSYSSDSSDSSSSEPDRVYTRARYRSSHRTSPAPTKGRPTEAFRVEERRPEGVADTRQSGPGSEYDNQSKATRDEYGNLLEVEEADSDDPTPAEGAADAAGARRLPTIRTYTKGGRPFP